jgi:FixJ family two-component response regulator
MQEHGERVSLVLSDVIMPKQTGYDLGQAVLVTWPETEIVLMSGYTPVALDRHGIGTSDFHLLRKPVNDLAGVVARQGVLCDYKYEAMDAQTRNRLGHFIIEYQRDALRRRQAWYQAEVVGLHDDLFDL